MPYPVRATDQNPYGPQVEFRTEEVLPPSALYLSMDDTVIAQVDSSTVNPAFTLSLRMLLADGTLQSEVYNSVQNLPVQTQAVVVIPPVEGYLLSCVAQLNATVDGSAWMWMRTFKGVVQLPIITLPPPSGMLITQGELDEQSFVAWPNSPADQAGTGAGRMRNITPTASTGAPWVLQTGANQRWEVLGFRGFLTASAVVANRVFAPVLYDRLGNACMRYPTNFPQTAGTGWDYFLYPGAAHLQTNTNWVTAPLPTSLILDPGMYLQGTVQNMDGGDAWSSITALVREWMGVGHG